MSQKCSSEINWELLSKAQKHYTSLGFEYIEVPWMVGQKAVLGTLPEHIDLEIYNDRINLVGSAEQSFIQMMLDGKLKPGAYQAISPCFRKESVYDDLHQHHFMKLELIIIRKDSDDRFGIEDLINPAKTFFEKHSKYKIEILSTEEGADLMLKDIELGSYGERSYEDNFWIYGTGLAEPRFSYALNIK